MPHHYRITYFEARGLGEEFEDVRIPDDKWDAFKPSTPFGQMPYLEVDGKALPQSFAMARYLAREFGYAGKSNFEAAWVDALGDQYKDYGLEIRPYLRLMEDEGEAKQKALKEHAIPARDKYYALIEKQLKSTGTGYLVGDSLTWIDLVVAQHVETLLHFTPGFFDGFPKVLEHSKKIQSIPKIAAWIKRRPQNHF